MQEKTCARCRVPKPLDDFGMKNSARGWRHCYCKECMKEFRKEHYRSSPGPYKERVQARKLEVKRLYFQYLSEKNCVDCGEGDPVLLEPDHVRGTKSANVSVLIHEGRTWRVILSELEKCDIRCVVCHRRKTAREQGWYKLLGVSANGKPPVSNSGQCGFDSRCPCRAARLHPTTCSLRLEAQDCRFSIGQRGFDSPRERRAPVAQMEERRSTKAGRAQVRFLPGVPT